MIPSVLLYSADNALRLLKFLPIQQAILILWLCAATTMSATGTTTTAPLAPLRPPAPGHDEGISKYDNTSVNANPIAATAPATTTSDTDAKSHRLLRQKRFVAFPVGSSFSAAVCLTTGVLGNPNFQYLSMGLNWGIAYELPNVTWVLEHVNGFGAKKESVLMPTIKRRYRRELYGKLETLISGSFQPTHFYPWANQLNMRQLAFESTKYLQQRHSSNFY